MEDYFQQRLNPHLGQQYSVCGVESKETTVCVLGNEGPSHPLQQCGSLMCFESFWTTVELYGSEEEDNQAAIHTQYLLGDTVLVFSWDLMTVRKIWNITRLNTAAHF